MIRFLCIATTLFFACGSATPPPVDGGTGGGAGGGGGSNTTADCASTTAALCDRGAACHGTTSLIQRSIATAEHDTAAMCKTYYQYFTCQQADAGVPDWADCSAAITAAACVTTTQGNAAPIPTECGALSL